MKKYIKVIKITIPTLAVLTFLIYICYFKTEIGYASYDGYQGIHAPLWFEALVTTIFLPFAVGFNLYDKYFNE